MSKGRRRVPRTLHVLTLAAALAVLARVGAFAAAAEDKVSQEVTVTAERAKRAKSVTQFVEHAAALENEEGVPLWRAPVCPQESGLPRQEGEWVLLRIVEIARAAGVPVARGHCHPNLYIFVSSDPEVVLRRTKANNRNRITMFGDATPFVINQFIDTPRVVRVWYKSSEGPPSGPPMGSKLGGLSAADRPTLAFVDASHIRASVVWTFSLVVEVADQRRLKELTLGQFADYAAMVALAKIKPSARLGDAPTILKLFDGSPKAAPAGMTDWDRAFLKSLYASDQRSKMQRDEVARAMVRELVH